MRGVLPFALNASAVDQGFARAWREAHVVNRSMDFSLAQGVQVDWSFAFHGPQLQIGSYGQDFMSELLTFIDASAGTRWVMPSSAADTLCSFAARGMAWLSVGRAWPWTGVGRQVSRPTLGSEYGVSLDSTQVRSLAAECSDSGDASGVRAWADSLDFLPPSPPLVGARHFYATDVTSVKRAAWAADLRVHSNRTDVPECGNGESLVGRYMAEGVLNIYNTSCGEDGAADTSCGREWGGVFPLLQWTRLGGTLSLPAAPIANCSGVCCWDRNGYVSHLAFVSGASDGYIAVTAMDTAITSGVGVTPLTAHRSWVFLADSIIALTANISGSPLGQAAETSLSQRFLRDPRGVLVGGAAGDSTSGTWLPDGEHPSLPGRTWAWSDGTAWLFGAALTGNAAPHNDVLSVSAGMRNGTWQSIGAYTGNVEGRVATLALSHGVPPPSGDGPNSVYAALPGVDAAAAPTAVAAASAALLVVNTAAAQAGGHAGERAAAVVFWPTGSGSGGSATLTSSPQWPGASFSVTLSADAASLVTFAEVDAAGVTLVYVAAASPLYMDRPLRVTVSRSLEAPSSPAPARGAGGPLPVPCAAAPAPGGGTLLTFALPQNANTTQGAAVVMACKLS